MSNIKLFTLVIITGMSFVFVVAISSSTKTLTKLVPLYESLANNFDVSIFTEEKDFTDEFHSRAGSVSFMKLSLLNSSDTEFELFCSRNNHAIIIHAVNSSSFMELLKLVCTYLKCPHHFQRKQLWTPHVLLIWPYKIPSHKIFENEVIRMHSSSCLLPGNSLLIDSEVYVLASNEGDQVQLYELYSIQNLTFFSKIPQPVSELTIETFRNKLLRRTNFRGAKIRALAWERPGYAGFITFNEVEGELVITGGYNVNYFDAIARSLNSSTTGVRSIESGVITRGENGTIGGVGKQLVDQEADISLMHSEYIPYRAVHLAYLHPIYVTRAAAFFKQPAATTIRDIYIGSIKTNLRFAIICTWTLILVCLWTISFVQKLYFVDSDRDDGAHDRSLLNAMQWGIIAICQQGSHIQPNSTSMKIGVLVGLLFSVIIYLGVSACIVSQLSVPVTPIKSFDDILKSDMKIYKDDMTQSAAEFLERITKKGLLKPMSLGDRTISAEEAFQQVIDKRAVYLSVEDGFYGTGSGFLNLSDDYLCEISEITLEPIGLPLLNAMTMKKDSPYVEFFRYRQLGMRESGIHQRLHTNYVGLAKPRCQKIFHQEPPQLGLNDTMNAFTFLLIMEIISLLLLGLEIHFKRLRYNSSSEDLDEKEQTTGNHLYGNATSARIVFCPNGGHPNESENLICGYCGVSLRIGHRCKSCLVLILEDWTHCFECGFVQTNQPTESPEP